MTVDLTRLVKPLVWRNSHFMKWNGDYHTVPTGYTVRCADENGWKWKTAGGFGYAHSPEAAQAAANADHAARVLAALDQEKITALVEAAYLAGFNSSGEGYNGEYPFGDSGCTPDQRADWIERRDATLSKLGAQP